MKNFALSCALALMLSPLPASAQGYEGVVSGEGADGGAGDMYYDPNPGFQPDAQQDIYGFVAAGGGAAPPVTAPTDETPDTLEGFVSEAGLSPQERARQRQQRAMDARNRQQQEYRDAQNAERQRQRDAEQEAWRQQQAEHARKMKAQYGIDIPVP